MNTSLIPTYVEPAPLNFPPEMESSGSDLGSVTRDIKEAIDNREPLDYWQPARILRGIIDYKIDNPDKISDVPELVSSATDCVTGLYTGTVTAKAYQTFTRQLEVYDGLLDVRIYQDGDGTSAKASNPKYSREAAWALRQHLSDDHILLLALGHGGVIPGMEVLKAYKQDEQATRSRLYPVRFSVYKSGDKRPKIETDEIKYLRHLAMDRQVVVFDEDVVEGRTLQVAMGFINETLDTTAIPLANLDAQEELAKRDKLYLLGQATLDNTIDYRRAIKSIDRDLA